MIHLMIRTYDHRAENTEHDSRFATHAHQGNVQLTTLHDTHTELGLAIKAQHTSDLQGHNTARG